MFFRKSIAKLLSDSDCRRVFHDVAYRAMEKAEKTPQALSEVERLAIRLRWLVAETMNGSLSQYLHNEAGNDFESVVLDLERIGASAAGEVLTGCRSLFPGGEVPEGRAERSRALSEVEDEAETSIIDRTRRFRELVPAIMKSACEYYRANSSLIGP